MNVLIIFLFIRKAHIQPRNHFMSNHTTHELCCHITRSTICFPDEKKLIILFCLLLVRRQSTVTKKSHLPSRFLIFFCSGQTHQNSNKALFTLRSTILSLLAVIYIHIKFGQKNKNLTLNQNGTKTHISKQLVCDI